MAPDDIEELRPLEESLWRAETRVDRAYMDQLLHAEFFEFGASGRVHSRQETLDAPFVELDAESPLPDFACRALPGEAAVVTYVSVVRFAAGTQTANRSSVWVRSPSGWQLQFHQGTPTVRGTT